MNFLYADINAGEATRKTLITSLQIQNRVCLSLRPAHTGYKYSKRAQTTPLRMRNRIDGLEAVIK